MSQRIYETAYKYDAYSFYPFKLFFLRDIYLEKIMKKI